MKKSIDELAREIVTKVTTPWDGKPTTDIIAAYLRDLFRPGHVLTREGDDVIVRKVLGTLPVTKDGAVVGDDCKVFTDSGVDVNTELFRSPLAKERNWRPFLPRKMFSTREAALAANPPTTGKREDV